MYTYRYPKWKKNADDSFDKSHEKRLWETKKCWLPEAAIGTLTHYHTMPHFDALKIYSCPKHCEKRRNCLYKAISHFLTMFSTVYGTYFSFEMHFKMSSAICFNLDQFKILSSGNGLTIQIYHCQREYYLLYFSPNVAMYGRSGSNRY